MSGRDPTYPLGAQIGIGHLKGHPDGEGGVCEVEIGGWVVLVEIDPSGGSPIVSTRVDVHDIEDVAVLPTGEARELERDAAGLDHGSGVLHVRSHDGVVALHHRAGRDPDSRRWYG